MKRTVLHWAVIIAVLHLTSVQADQILGVEIPPVGKFLTCPPPPDCTPTMACDSPVTLDTRNCTRCFLFSPTGGCWQMGNDPMCEASKSAQNALYQTEAALRKLDCERLKSVSRLQCLAEGQQRTAACEASKAQLGTAARSLQAKYDQLLTLAERLTPFTVDPELQTSIYQRLPWQKVIPLRFYRFVRNDSLYNRFLLYWRPQLYANESDVPDVGILRRSGVQTAGPVTFVRTGYEVTIEDVVRSTVIAVFFERLAADGVAQLQESGKFSLEATTDSQTVRVCGSLESERSEYTCNRSAGF